MNDTIMEEVPATEPTKVDIPTTESSMAEVLSTDGRMVLQPTMENPSQYSFEKAMVMPKKNTTEAPMLEVQNTDVLMFEDRISDDAIVESPTTQDPLPEIPDTEAPLPKSPDTDGSLSKNPVAEASFTENHVAATTTSEKPTAGTIELEILPLRQQTDDDLDEQVIGELLENVIANSSLENHTNKPDEDYSSPDNNSSPSEFLDYGDEDDICKENLAVVLHNTSTDATVNGALEPVVEEEEEVEFIVEKILDKKVDSCGVVKYLVKWQNFTSKDNSWEPLEHLVECDKAMQEFELMRAQRLAERHNNLQNDMIANGTDKASHAAFKKRIMPSNHKEFEVNDVMGLTMVNNEKYFLISLANSTQKAFIRASLANTVFPSKVIDFYIKNINWKPRVDE